MDTQSQDLFAAQAADKIRICNDMWLLPRYAPALTLKRDINVVCQQAVLRHMVTSRGQRMSVAMTNCGAQGWVSDLKGYRYQSLDPLSGEPWPAMPKSFQQIATKAAALAGYENFCPDACLINRYEPGNQMGAHQDKNEQDFNQPIVSVSLGLPARFFIVGEHRKGKSIPVDLVSGDVIVWGGEARLYYHGVRPLKKGLHPDFGATRFNLTFRRALSA